METVEVVIRIPRFAYDMTRANHKVIYADEEIIGQAIINGTPLPKGHGRLKDTDAICKDIISALGIRDENYLLEAEKAIYKRIKNATTIIEADKAESEDK